MNPMNGVDNYVEKLFFRLGRLELAAKMDAELMQNVTLEVS